MKIQYARDDEGPHSCINQNKNIDNDLYCSSNEFPNHLALLTMIRVNHDTKCFFYRIIEFFHAVMIAVQFIVEKCGANGPSYAPGF